MDSKDETHWEKKGNIRGRVQKLHQHGPPSPQPGVPLGRALCCSAPNQCLSRALLWVTASPPGEETHFSAVQSSVLAHSSLVSISRHQHSEQQSQLHHKEERCL